jgi:peptide/nickel transport system substrate-binding protein
VVDNGWSSDSAGVTRRGLLMGGSALAVGLLAGCGAASVAAGRVRRGGQLQVASDGFGTTLDPAAPAFDYNPGPAIYDTLVVIGLNYEMQPWLASDWSSNSAATEWKFRLRDDVKFWDGSRLTSRDVRYSAQRVFDPTLVSPIASVLQPVLSPSGVEAPDPTTVVFRLTRPHALFPTLLADPGMRLAIIPEGSGDRVANSPIGSGPFKLVKFDPLGTTTLKANPDYFLGPPELDELLYPTVGDPTAQLDALIAKQIDATPRTANLTHGEALVARSGGCKIYQCRGEYWKILAMKCNMKPFTDVRVRQAFKYATDCAGLVTRVLQGLGRPAYHNPVPPEDQNAARLTWAYDPEKAKSLLAQAGYRDGVDVTLQTAAFTPVHVPLCEAFQEMAAPAGIRVTVNETSTSTYYSDAFVNGNFVIDWWGPRPSDRALAQFFLPGAVDNESNWDSPAFAALLAGARAELDAAKRTALYQDCQRLVQQESGAIIPFFEDTVVGLRDEVLDYGDRVCAGQGDPLSEPSPRALEIAQT